MTPLVIDKLLERIRTIVVRYFPQEERPAEFSDWLQKLAKKSVVIDTPIARRIALSFSKYIQSSQFEMNPHHEDNAKLLWLFTELLVIHGTPIINGNPFPAKDELVSEEEPEAKTATPTVVAGTLPPGVGLPSGTKPSPVFTQLGALQ